MRPHRRSWTSSTSCVPALYDFLLAVDAPRRMEERAAEHDAAGRLQLADEYRQLWEILVSAMEQFAWVRGDMPLTLDRFAQLFRQAFSALRRGNDQPRRVKAHGQIRPIRVCIVIRRANKPPAHIVDRFG